MRNIALIPARGGSKRIPRKNIKLFHNKPMIAWSIEAAKNSNCFDDIYVSTDDKEIASIAKKYGAKIPFLRDKELADDLTSTQAVVKNTIEKFTKEKKFFDYICCIYAASPFIVSSDIKKALNLILKSKQETYVFTATSFQFPIQRSINIDSDGYSKMKNSEFFNKRSQDMIRYYHDAGQFYWANTRTWINCPNIFENGRPLIIPNWRVQDIDNMEDFIRAEIMYESIKFFEQNNKIGS